MTEYQILMIFSIFIGMICFICILAIMLEFLDMWLERIVQKRDDKKWEKDFKRRRGHWPWEE